MFWSMLAALVIAAVVGYFTGHLVRRWGPRFGWVDQPGHRKVHAEPMPTGGGVAIWIGVVGPLAAGQLVLALLIALGMKETLAGWLPESVAVHLDGLWVQSQRLWMLLAGGTVLMILGLIDDRRGIDWKIRLGVQTLVAMGIVAFGWRASLFLDVPLVAEVVSVLWIVGLVNSFNMLDNMDGLSAGVAAICGSLLAAVMFLAPDPVTQQPQLFVGGFLLVFVGAVLGFLGHNFPPAKMFMGDGGSYFLGYLMATTTLSATFAGYDVPRQTIFVPVVILAVPLYDTVTVLAIRLRQGRSPFEGDKSHYSHRLVELGFTKKQAVMIIYLTTTACGLGALLLYEVPLYGAVLIFLQVLLLLILVGILETQGRRVRRK